MADVADAAVPRDLAGVRPMLATPTAAPPRGPGWVHEVKWDGMRLLAHVRDGRLRLTTRTGRDAAARFPELAGVGLDDAVVDGELVALANGRPSFAALSGRIHVDDPALADRAARRQPVTFFAFDLLRLDGAVLLDAPWSQRRGLLDTLTFDHARWVVPPTYDDGDALLDAAAGTGLEGVVSKRVGSRYTPGARSPDWLKRPLRTTRSVVVGGWRPETGSATRLGALLVGLPTAGGLTLLGRVGSGLAGRAGPVVLAALAGLESTRSPFAEPVPRADAEGARWVRPHVVVDVESLGTAGLGRLRQPSFRGLRPDLSPEDVGEGAP